MRIIRWRFATTQITSSSPPSKFPPPKNHFTHLSIWLSVHFISHSLHNFILFPFRFLTLIVRLQFENLRLQFEYLRLEFEYLRLQFENLRLWFEYLRLLFEYLRLLFEYLRHPFFSFGNPCYTRQSSFHVNLAQIWQ